MARATRALASRGDGRSGMETSDVEILLGASGKMAQNPKRK